MQPPRSQLLARIIAKAAATGPLVVPPTGPGGLLSVPGLSPAMRAKRDRARRRHKAEGEKVPIMGNLCRQGGEFAPCDAAAPPDEAAPADAGGGSASESAPAEAPARAPVAEREQALVDAGLPPSVAGAFDELVTGAADGEDIGLSPENKQALIDAGLVTPREGSDWAVDLTDTGKAVADAAMRGDGPGAAAAMQGAPPPVVAAPPPPRVASLTRTKAMKPGRKRLWQKAYRQAKAEGLAPDAARQQARMAIRAADKDRAWRGYERAVARVGKAAGDFAVYKDDAGRDRWLSRTTTAFEDRDREILALAALDADSQRMTKTGQFGPLRYWHAGRPERGTPDAPWGPGIDIGDCDYSVVIGRTRYESGTFRSPALAEAFKATADQYELSPGFYHPYGPAGPPDGVYRDMATFERSLVPVTHARAANYYTGLMVKEFRMNEQELERRVKAFVADMQRRGVPADASMALLGQGATAEKAADARGVAYKSQAAEPVYTGPDGTPGIIRDGQWLALKAGPPIAAPPAVDLKAPMPGAQMIEAGLTEAADGAERAAEEAEESEDRLLSDAEIGMIADAVASRLIGKIGEVQSAVSLMDEQMKGYGYARKEADALKAQVAGLSQQLASFTAAVKEFTDDLPISGHRASQDATTALRPDDALATVGAKNAGAQQEPRSIVEQIAAALPASIGGAGGIPWPFSAPPPAGVNVQQHAAPGAQPAS